MQTTERVLDDGLRRIVRHKLSFLPHGQNGGVFLSAQMVLDEVHIGHRDLEEVAYRGDIESYDFPGRSDFLLNSQIARAHSELLQEWQSSRILESQLQHSIQLFINDVALPLRNRFVSWSKWYSYGEKIPSKKEFLAMTSEILVNLLVKHTESVVAVPLRHLTGAARNGAIRNAATAITSYENYRQSNLTLYTVPRYF